MPAAPLSVQCPSKRGSVARGDVLERLAMLALTGSIVLATGCAPAARSPATAKPHATSFSPARAGGPCASVKTTTPITDVPQACAELWAPYQVTEVPPADILEQEHVPLAPPVVNRTNGAVSDAEAQRWANASNRDSGWYKWAYAYTQPGLLLKLVGPALIPGVDEIALGNGAEILVPDCDLYPTSYQLFRIGEDGRTYFERKRLPTDDAYTFVVTFTGPCKVRTTYPDGHVTYRQAFAGPTVVFEPGALRSDRILGDLWFGDAGGGCDDPSGPPAEWCSR